MVAAFEVCGAWGHAVTTWFVSLRNRLPPEERAQFAKDFRYAVSNSLRRSEAEEFAHLRYGILGNDARRSPPSDGNGNDNGNDDSGQPPPPPSQPPRQPQQPQQHYRQQQQQQQRMQTMMTKMFGLRLLLLLLLLHNGNK